MTRVGLPEIKAPCPAESNVAMAVGMQGVCDLKRPRRVMPHQTVDWGVEREVIAPDRYQERDAPVGICRQHAFKRDAHGVYQVGLDPVREPRAVFERRGRS